MANNSVDLANSLEFQRIQHDFSGHIKDPKNTSKPADVDDRHMTVYRDLFFKNIMSFLDGAFPVLAEIIGTKRWQEIGRQFFIQHENKSPYFLEISQEFLTFLETEFVPKENDPEYMYELAHYEWLELFVSVEPSVEPSSAEPVSEMLDDKNIETSTLVLSPVVEGFVYSYPVHQISVDNPAAEPKSTALIVYRGRDDEVHFVETNPFTLQLLAQFKKGRRCGQEVLNELLISMGIENNPAAYQGGLDTLKYWLSLGIIWNCYMQKP